MLTIKKRIAPFSSLTLTILGLVSFGGCTPPGPRAVRDGERLIREGKFDRAIRRLEEGARLLPKSAPVWNHLGLAYHNAGRADDAVRAYQQALALDRNLAAARYNLGCLYLEQGNATAAVVELTTYTVLQPNAYAGWVKLATAQLRGRQLDVAERSFRQAQRLNGRAPEALNGLGLVQMQRKHYVEARQQFSGALRQQPDYAPALLNVAIVSHQHLNNRTFALQKYREYLALKPLPPNSADVQKTASHLDAELRAAATDAATQLAAASKPPDSTATNKAFPPTIATNKTPAASVAVAPQSSPRSTIVAVAPSASQTPPRTPLTTSAPPTRVAASNSVVSAKTEVVSSPPSPQKVEVVRLEQEEPVKPVRDITFTDPARAPTNNAADARAPSKPVAAPVQSLAKHAAEPAANQPSGEKSGVINRLIPRNWFRSNSKNSPVPPAGVKEIKETAAAETNKTRPDQGRMSAPAGLSSQTRVRMPRYKYRSPVPPKPGNRGEAERLVADGAWAHQRNRLSEAVEAYRKATKADPSFFEAHYNLGVAAFEADDLPQALTAYEYALAVNPISVKARFNFAVALQRANCFRDAANELEKLLADNAAESRAHFTLATLYAQQLGEPQKARTHYVRVLELEPQHPQATAIRFWLEANP